MKMSLMRSAQYVMRTFSNYSFAKHCSYVIKNVSLIVHKNGIQLRFINVPNRVPKHYTNETKLRYCKTYLMRSTK